MGRVTKLNHAGMRELLNDPSVGAMLEEKMQSALAQARAAAPVATGAYRDGLHLEVVHTDRIGVHLAGSTDHDLAVEADTGNLARALDSAG